MMWFAGAFLLMSAGVAYGAYRVEIGPGSADERLSSAYLYLAAIALFVLAAILWAIGVTAAAFGHH